MKKITYKSVGVDISNADKFVEGLKPFMSLTGTDTNNNTWSGFANVFSLPYRNGRDICLVTCCDGVGTKVLLAKTTKDRITIGIDVVAMCVNDCITTGAAPLLFLDYFATGKLNNEYATDIIRGIARGCHLAGCRLVGGETAELPHLFRKSDYDVAGFNVGYAEAKDIITPNVKEGQIVWGFTSNGVHSNGFSLINKIVKKRKKTPDSLLKPTIIYVPHIKELLKTVKVSGMAHITGGGLPGNLVRILPPDVDIVLEESKWKEQSIFRWIEKFGPVSEKEMFNTFNMGIGFVFITPKNYLDKVKTFSKKKYRCFLIGETIPGTGKVRIITRKGNIIC